MSDKIPQPITEGQLKEAGQLLTQPFVDHGVTDVDYQEVILRDPKFKALLRAAGDYTRGFIARRDLISRNLFVDALPENFTKANTKLVYDWSGRFSEEDRLNRIAQAANAKLDIRRVILEDSVVAMPAWQSDLVISPVDLLLQQGIDPQRLTNRQYCDLVRPLCQALTGVNLGDYFKGCVEKDGAQLDGETLTAWLTLPTTQQKGGALIVRRMAVNPAIWFDAGNGVYSFAPLHTPGVFAKLLVTNKVKKVLPGDLIVAASFFIGEPHLIDQIKAGTCPRTDIPGTQLRDGGAWSARPNLRRRGSDACLDGSVATIANEDFGSLGCAGE